MRWGQGTGAGGWVEEVLWGRGSLTTVQYGVSGVGAVSYFKPFAFPSFFKKNIFY